LAQQDWQVGANIWCCSLFILTPWPTKIGGLVSTFFGVVFDLLRPSGQISAHLLFFKISPAFRSNFHVKECKQICDSSFFSQTAGACFPTNV
jgi:hypothetical protein